MSVSGKWISAYVGTGTPALVPGVQEWEAEDTAVELDATTAEDQGFEHPDDGLWSLRVRMTMVMDITFGEFTPLQRGTVLTNLELFSDADSLVPVYSIPTFKIFRSVPRGEINGRVTYNVEGKAIGEYFIEPSV